MQPLEWNHAQTKDSYLANLGSWLSNFGDIPPIRHVDNDESKNVNWTVTHCQGKGWLLPIFGRHKAYFHCFARSFDTEVLEVSPYDVLHLDGTSTKARTNKYSSFKNVYLLSTLFNPLTPHSHPPVHGRKESPLNLVNQRSAGRGSRRH